MKYFIFALALFALTINQSITFITFDDYIHDFNKTYDSEQYVFRKGIYDQRIQEYALITDYTPGINVFTDWTDQQISQLTPKDLSNSASDQASYSPPSNNIISVSSSSVSAPVSLDWRVAKAVTSIKDQGKCGSCWAFSVAAYVESKLIIQKNYSTKVDLSEQYLVSCTSGSNCDGGWISDALKLVASNGIPYEASYSYNPYGSVDSQICKTQNVVTEAGRKSYTLRNVNDQKIIDLLQAGPLSIQISSQKWTSYGAGVFTCQKNATIDHAVLLVGYTADSWIIKNQWGSNWGQNGYIRVTRSRSGNYSNCFIGSTVVFMQAISVSNSFESSLFSITGCFLMLLLFLSAF